MATAEAARQPASGRIVLPADLERRLHRFRALVGRTKLLEAACMAVAGAVTSQLVLFAIDRLGDTPAWVRGALFLAAAAAVVAVPVAAYRWVWRVRGLDQVARLVGRTFASLGDQLLGIIEIVREHAAGGPTRSTALCEAAVRQVADRATRYDLREAVPRSRLGLWTLLAATPLLASAALAVMAPAAAGNAWARLLAPWRDVPRYTFARITPLPDTLVVAHGEPTALSVRLADDSRWRPREAVARPVGQQTLVAPLEPGDGGYAFAVPPQLEPVVVALAVGDARQRVAVEPLLRPESTGIEAEVELPEYLARPGVAREDVRGGAVAPVRGSRVRIVATADRPLAEAEVDGRPVAPDGSTVTTDQRVADEDATVTIGWTDRHGLAAARPLTIRIAPHDDAAPTVATSGLPLGSAILLETDTLAFSIVAGDDFGVRRVGIEWEPYEPVSEESDEAGFDATAATEAVTSAVRGGERVLEGGGPEATAVDVAATFSPQRLGIAPQPLVLRAFAEDFLPGRERSRSAPVLLYVVDREEHAFILNEQLNRWRQQAGEVRDREMALLATNRELRGLPAEALDDAETRDRIQTQAAAERANARRLERLVDEGAGLVREAVKNPEFEAALLESLAGDIETLADIAATRMPGVADLLRAAARAEPGAGSQAAGAPESGQQPAPDKPDATTEPGALAGQPGQPSSQPPAEGQPPSPSGTGQPSPPALFPSLTDRESSQQPDQSGSAEPSPSGPPRFGMPSTQAGIAPPGEGGPKPPPAAASLDRAIAEQEALLEAFAEVADDLAAVMARLEGSTFVKRFKLASREQGSIGGRLAALGAAALARPERQPDGVQQALDEVVASNSREAEKVSHLMDDLQAYFERRRLPAFLTVLEEMKELDALGSLRQLSNDIPDEAGLSIAQTEFWSDTFDRLADDLVPPPEEGDGQSGESEAGNVPPEVVLEALRILEAEVHLREETRVVEQARDVARPGEFAARAAALAEEQHGLGDRMAKLAETLIDTVVGPLPFGQNAPLLGPLELPDGRDVFRNEIALFDRVEEVMREAADILARPDTGSEAIAAETEAIELLLASRAAGGGGGGGGGMALMPGGGGTGTARTPALATMGRGNRSDRGTGGGEEAQATGATGRELPEEFRSGLDDYFNRLEREQP
jgi:hypothetical protein